MGGATKPQWWQRFGRAEWAALAVAVAVAVLVLARAAAGAPIHDGEFALSCALLLLALVASLRRSGAYAVWSSWMRERFLDASESSATSDSSSPWGIRALAESALMPSLDRLVRAMSPKQEPAEAATGDAEGNDAGNGDPGNGDPGNGDPGNGDAVEQALARAYKKRQGMVARDDTVSLDPSYFRSGKAGGPEPGGPDPSDAEVARMQLEYKRACYLLCRLRETFPERFDALEGQMRQLCGLPARQRDPAPAPALAPAPAPAPLDNAKTAGAGATARNTDES